MTVVPHRFTAADLCRWRWLRRVSQLDSQFSRATTGRPMRMASSSSAAKWSAKPVVRACISAPPNPGRRRQRRAEPISAARGARSSSSTCAPRLTAERSQPTGRLSGAAGAASRLLRRRAWPILAPTRPPTILKDNRRWPGPPGHASTCPPEARMRSKARPWPHPSAGCRAPTPEAAARSGRPPGPSSSE